MSARDTEYQDFEVVVQDSKENESTSSRDKQLDLPDVPPPRRGGKKVKNDGVVYENYAGLSESTSSRDKQLDLPGVPHARCGEKEVKDDGAVYQNVIGPPDVCSDIEKRFTLTDEENVYIDLTEVIYKLRDVNRQMVASWQEAFKNHPSRVQVSYGDIFKGAPQADALVSPANSFGFMDGGIDMVYSQHFGWQMQERLQAVIQQEYNGEILVGQAVIIPAFPEGTPEKDMCIQKCNEDKPIKYLISAPTMRVPIDVMDTANAYLAFRGIILAVRTHNENPANKDSQIRSVLCPGLGTAVGRMPAHRCAKQMLEAFTAYELGLKPGLIKPKGLHTVWTHHTDMAKC